MSLESSIWLNVLMLFVLASIGVFAIKNKNRECLIFLYAGLAVVLSFIYLFKNIPIALVGNGGRYFYLPAVFFLFCIISLLNNYRQVAVTLLVIVYSQFFFNLESYQDQPLIDYHWAQNARCVGKKLPCNIRINPKGSDIRLKTDSGLAVVNRKSGVKEKKENR